MVELLVAIAIILVLASIGIPTMLAIQKQQKVKNTRANIELIETAFKEFQGDFGDYPSAALLSAKLTEKGASMPSQSSENLGNEVMVACMATLLPELFGKPAYLPVSLTGVEGDKLIDLDGDGMKELPDAWNRPYIYFHYSQYHSSVQQTYNHGLNQDNNTNATAKAKSDGVYFRLTDYQFWSCGPNQANDTNCSKTSGTSADDDIRNWSDD